MVVGILSLLAVLGLNGPGQQLATSGDLGGYGDSVYTDVRGHVVCYLNGTATGETGQLFTWGNLPYWYNGSIKGYLLIEPETNSVTGYDVSAAVGMVAIVLSVSALGCVVGLRVVGSGTSDTAVRAVVITTALLAVWGVFSVLGLALLNTIPLLGPSVYFILTGVYTLGIILSIGGSGGSD